MDQIDLQMFRDASTRLNPLRKLLADVALVVDTTANIFQQKAEAEASVISLEAARQATLRQSEEARAQLLELQRHHDKAKVDLAAKMADFEAAASERRVAIQRELDRAQAAAQQAIAQAQTEHAQILADLARQKQEAEQALQQAQEYVKAVSERLKDFV